MLRAFDVMRPATGPAEPARSVAPETALRDALPYFAAKAEPVWVVKDGQVLGEVPPGVVFETLAPRETRASAPMVEPDAG